MSRRLPRAFFWIDQNLIRSGAWGKLSAEARLAYVAVSASCDRDGVSIWSRAKLMELSAIPDPDVWRERLLELESHRLIEPLPEHSPPAIRLVELDREATAAAVSRPSPDAERASSPLAGWSGGVPAAPIIVHTQTTIHLGGKPPHVEPGNPD
jgi:hypothetical protein